jgi:nitroreductase
MPLDEAILQRHSTRLFLSTPVPQELLYESLALAQHAPSNSNIQPWRSYIVSGAARDRLREALLKAAEAGGPNIPPLPAEFTHFRSDLGKQVYGKGMGIARDNVLGRAAAVMRNYEFFQAPVVAITCMHRDLDLQDAVGVGMYLQTLLLSLTERGLDSCVEVSLAGYPDVIRNELSVPENLTILCGVAIGYGDTAFGANKLRIQRLPIEGTTTFVTD